MKKKISLIVICAFAAVLSCSCMTGSMGACTYQPDGSYDINVTEVTFYSILGNNNKVKVSAKNLVLPVISNWNSTSLEGGTCINIAGVSDYVIFVAGKQVTKSSDFSDISTIYIAEGADRYPFHKI